MDKYKNFEDLSNHCKINEDYEILHHTNFNNEILIFTPHGGGIEPGTTELVQEIASTDMSWYTFNGIKSTNNKSLHITSTNFDQFELLYKLKRSVVTVSIHGCEDTDSIIYIGGRDTQLSNDIFIALENKLKDDNILIHKGENHLEGKNPNNITNKNKINAGVQIEFSEGVRKQMFLDFSKRKGRETKTPLFWKIVTILREVIYPQIFEN